MLAILLVTFQYGIPFCQMIDKSVENQWNRFLYFANNGN